MLRLARAPLIPAALLLVVLPAGAQGAAGPFQSPSHNIGCFITASMVPPEVTKGAVPTLVGDARKEARPTTAENDEGPPRGAALRLK